MSLSYLLRHSIILLICICWQIQPAVLQQTWNNCTTTPSLRKHESMCQHYKRLVFEKVFIFGSLSMVGGPMKLCVDTCAPSTGLIVGGIAAKPKEFPHIASLGNTPGVGLKPSWFCGGTLISYTFVLTAAHCFADSEIVNIVRLGELVFDSTDDDAMPVDYDVKRYISHPNYNNQYAYYDIGLVELNSSAIFSEYVLPACLPIGNGEQFNKFIAVGWGSTDFAVAGSKALLKVTLDRYNAITCNEFAKQSRTLPHGLVEKEQLCAGSTEAKDTCWGDSGGPLLQYSNITCMFQVVGITSVGQGCGFSDVPGIYTRVYDYIDWIEDIVW